ncbi:hypothetical protein PHMEG_0008879 [Phytophthora megakarya]|uniref:FYVE-type domain-containing protein n=1 Tax=Phytophthora megakarya TaxID=4795 RepID=A0A225WJN6_9STRA|nr:hypothetical protein PHMEG_0008879 [Phytophthora megakarya]
MMKRESSRVAFQPISLSPSDTAHVQVVTKAILDANLDRYQHFTDADNGKADPSLWKLVKTKDQLSAYVQRQRKYRAFPFQVNPLNQNCELQSLLLTGSISGTLGEAMHGMSNPQADDDLSHAAVISEIKSSTKSDSVMSTAMKWLELDVRMKSMGFVKNHDYVYVETIGILQSNGITLGYRLLHSADHPQAHTLPGRIRGQLSVCTFFRQVSENSVSVYTLGMIDSIGDKAQRVLISRLIKTLLTNLRNCGQKKRKYMPMMSGKLLGDVIKLGSHGGDHCCVICSKRVLRFGKLMTHRSTCSVCSGSVCSSCKLVQKKKCVTATLKVISRKVVFCSSAHCLNIALANVPYVSFAEQSTSAAGFYTGDYRWIWESGSRISASGNMSVAW